MIKKPKVPIELARNLKYIFDHDLLLRNDFCAQTTLPDFFNIGDITIINEKNGVLIFTTNFLGRFDGKLVSRVWDESAPRVSLSGGKQSLSSSASVTAAINSSMSVGGPSFEQTINIFGKNFVRPIEAFLPHGLQPPPSAPHGNEPLEYQQFDGVTSKSVDLGFNPSG